VIVVVITTPYLARLPLWVVQRVVLQQQTLTVDHDDDGSSEKLRPDYGNNGGVDDAGWVHYSSPL